MEFQVGDKVRMKIVESFQGETWGTTTSERFTVTGLDGDMLTVEGEQTGAYTYPAAEFISAKEGELRPTDQAMLDWLKMQNK